MSDVRAFWAHSADLIARPVLVAMAEDRLMRDLPADRPDREEFKALEATARVLSGISPWLERDDAPDGLFDLATRAISVGLDRNSECRFNFRRSIATKNRFAPYQGTVDAAFLAQALIRAPRFWAALSLETRQSLIEGFIETRSQWTGQSNWLLFSGLTEAFIATEHPELAAPDRIDRAIRSMCGWYLGDGMYGDGPPFHGDYYNSFVIHPMLLELVERVRDLDESWARFHGDVLQRARRHLEYLERLISPEGTFPPIGRSIAYRFGAMHHLALMALRRDLPPPVSPASARGALTAVLNRFIDGGIFDDQGWLTIGFVGENLENPEGYIGRASVYGFCWGFLPLGLGADDRFWSDPDEPWTSKRAWNGLPFRSDHAI